MDTVQFLKLAQKITSAYDKHEYDEARKFIYHQLDLVKEFQDHWNHSNILHQSHTFLGLIALEEDKIEEAKAQLIKSAEIKGSPQINSFGPNMLLAKMLLELEQTQVVLQYLEKCEKFWLPRMRRKKLKLWRNEINMNKFPDFGFHLEVHLRTHESEIMKKKFNLD